MNLGRMSEEELRELNAEIVAEMRSRQREQAIKAAGEFKLNQIVEFRSGKGLFSPLVKMRITKINPTTISGIEVDNPLKKWRVHPTLLKAAV